MENNTTTTATAANTQPTAAHEATAAPAAGPAIEVAASKKKQDTDKLMQMADLVQGLYLDVISMMDNYNYPPLSKKTFAEATAEFTRHLGLAAQHIIDPESEEMPPEIRRRIECGID